MYVYRGQRTVTLSRTTQCQFIKMHLVFNKQSALGYSCVISSSDCRITCFNLFLTTISFNRNELLHVHKHMSMLLNLMYCREYKFC